MDHDELATLRDRWREDAAARAKGIPNDPTAAVLALCAAELEEALLRQAARPLSPAEYATLHGVTPQAVTQWCRRGILEAYRDATGHWRIPPTATHLERAA
jgi:DNA-directed RNA polymerase specialized sigma24 family protein